MQRVENDNEQWRSMIGKGLSGQRLPSFWSVYDAEMYTVIERMKTVLRRMMCEGAEPGDDLIVTQ